MSNIKEKIAVLRRIPEPRAFQINWTRTPEEYQCVLKTIEWYKDVIESLIEDLKDEHATKPEEN